MQYAYEDYNSQLSINHFSISIPLELIKLIQYIALP